MKPFRHSRWVDWVVIVSYAMLGIEGKGVIGGRSRVKRASCLLCGNGLTTVDYCSWGLWFSSRHPKFPPDPAVECGVSTSQGMLAVRAIT